MCVTGVVQDNFAHCGTPTDVFLALLGEDMVEHITYQSNLYATQKNKSLNLKEHELLCTIGINFVMGYHSLPAIEHYWSTASDMNVAAVSSTMPRARSRKYCLSCMPMITKQYPPVARTNFISYVQLLMD